MAVKAINVAVFIYAVAIVVFLGVMIQLAENRTPAESEAFRSSLDARIQTIVDNPFVQITIWATLALFLIGTIRAVIRYDLTKDYGKTIYAAGGISLFFVAIVMAYTVPIYIDSGWSWLIVAGSVIMTIMTVNDWLDRLLMLGANSSPHNPRTAVPDAKTSVDHDWDRHRRDNRRDRLHAQT